MRVGGGHRRKRPVPFSELEGIRFPFREHARKSENKRQEGGRLRLIY